MIAKRLMALAGIMLMSLSLLADGGVTVTGVTAQQRYPWNNKVDIVVTIQGLSNDVADAYCIFLATNCVTQTPIPTAHITRNGADVGSDTTWTRRFIWDAAADVGSVKIEDVALTVKVDMGVQLWENGPYWARCNVGAFNPEESGYYFWWGDTVGYKRNAANNDWESVKDGSSYSSNGCLTFDLSKSSLQSRGYIDATGNLVAAHDAVAVYLGSPWRMPTGDEMSALIRNCDTTWTTNNGVSGRLVIGRGAYATKSIFLPAAGYGSGTYFSDGGSYGALWSSTPGSCFSGYSEQLYFDLGEIVRQGTYYRNEMWSVRPLRGFAGIVSGVVSDENFTTHLKLDCRGGVRQPLLDGETIY